jgi:hypothetical protein
MADKEEEKVRRHSGVRATPQPLVVGAPSPADPTDRLFAFRGLREVQRKVVVRELLHSLAQAHDGKTRTIVQEFSRQIDL